MADIVSGDSLREFSHKDSFTKVRALSVVQGILVARWLGPELYGASALVMAYPSLVHGFFDARSMSASVKYLGEYHARGEHDRARAMCKLGYGVDLVIACFTLLVLVLTAHWAAQSIAHNSAVAGLMVLGGAALIPQAFVGTSNAVLATFGRFPVIALIEIVTTLLRVMLVIGLVLAGWQVAGVVWANAIAAMATGLLYGGVAWALIRHAWGGSIFQGSLKALKGRRREIFSFLAYNDLSALIATIPTQLDAILLGYFRNPAEVGFYKLAKSSSNLGGYLLGPLKSVTYAELTRLWGLGEERAFSEKVKKMALWIGFPSGVLVLLGAGLMSFALPLLVGEVYIPAVAATQLLCIGSAISLAFFWLHLIYLAQGHVRQLSILNGSVTVGFGLVYPFVIQQWGFMGACAWMLGLNVVGTGCSGFWLWRQQVVANSNTDRGWNELIDRPTAADKKALCFTLWFRNHHNNCRYAVLFPQLAWAVQFRKLTLSHRRVLRALQFRLWMALRRKLIYPAVARYFGGRYPTVFTVDTYQIPAWPEAQRVVVDMDDPLFSPTEIEILKLAQVKALVVTTERAKAIYQERGVTCPIHVIPQGVSLEQIDPKRIREIRAQLKGDRDIVVGYHAPTLTLSSDGPSRARAGMDDLDFLFAAFEDARKIESRIKLWLIGQVSRSVKRYAADGRSDWIKILGYVPFSDILNYVSMFDIGVYPRTWAQPPGRFNVKFAEFMACGIPVVSTNLDESFILGAAHCGIVCDSKQQFSEVLVELAQSAEKRAELGRAGLKYARRNLDWSVLVAAYKEILMG
jgi:O-antigen/teichoic acid export membrane protein/glycosyltransferase involved in cell wall biosynthesis